LSKINDKTEEISSEVATPRYENKTVINNQKTKSELVRSRNTEEITRPSQSLLKKTTNPSSQILTTDSLKCKSSKTNYFSESTKSQKSKTVKRRSRINKTQCSNRENSKKIKISKMKKSTSRKSTSHVAQKANNLLISKVGKKSKRLVKSKSKPRISTGNKSIPKLKPTSRTPRFNLIHANPISSVAKFTPAISPISVKTPATRKNKHKKYLTTQNSSRSVITSDKVLGRISKLPAVPLKRRTGSSKPKNALKAKMNLPKSVKKSKSLNRKGWA